MFGSSKSTDDSKTTAASTSTTSGGLNALVKGTSVEGNINCESDLRIDGTLKGKLVCKSKVIIGPTGVIEGQIVCQNAVIEGRFKGVLTVHELLNIRETADVDGEITTGKLIVQSGAKFNVACKMETGTNGSTKSISNANDAAKIATGKPTVSN